MKRLVIGLVVVVALLGGGYAVFGNELLAGGTKVEPTPVPVVREEKRVVSDGRVVPVRAAALSLPAGGVVAEVLVKEGDRVEAGQVLVRLESWRQQAAVRQAEAGLSRARANLAQVKAGPREGELEAARAAVAAAEAQLLKVRRGATAEDLGALEASLLAAEAGLLKALEGAEEGQVVLARADLASAEAALKQAQAAYDRISHLADVQARPEALALERATIAYVSSQNRLDLLLGQPTESVVKAAEAQVLGARVALDKAKTGARVEDIAAVEAEVRRARAQLGLLESGARDEMVALAEAEVQAAEAGLEQARAALREAELRAPFGGDVASVDAVVGEQVGPGAALVRLADVSGWLVETTDLTELSVVELREGDRARIVFDALPDLEVEGVVERVRGFGQSRQGDIVYTVTVRPVQHEERLRWNMTASVTIYPKD